MTDLAQLGIQIQTSGAKEAATDLDAFAKKAADAGTAADTLTTKTAAMGKAADGAAVAGQSLTSNAQRVTAAVGQQASVMSTAAAATAGVTAAHVALGTAAGTAAKATDELGHAHEGMSTQAMSAFHSVRSMAEGIAMGMPPTQVLTQQLNHLSYAASGEGGLTGAFGELIGMAGRMVTPFTLVAGGAVALGGAAIYAATSWQTGQKQIEQSLLGIGARSGATVDSINKIASSSASATKLSVDQARTIATEFTKTGNIGVGSIEGLTKATQGFSVVIGKDATTAGTELAKIMGGDLVSAATQLNDIYGTIDGRTMEYIRTLQDQGDKQKAIQVILDNITPTNQKAVDSLGLLERAWATMGNAASAAKEAIGSVGAPASLQQQMDALQTQRAAVAAAPSTMGGNYGMVENFVDPGIAAKASALALLDQTIAEVQKKMDALSADAADKQLIKLANEADAVTKSLIPQIAQIQQLEAELGKLQEAQANPDVAGRMGMSSGQVDAATVAGENAKQALQESEAEAARYNDRVKEIAASWGDVGQSTALSLQASQNNLPVIQAVGGAAKMAAQYAADYANALDAGKSPADALALAADRLQNSLAQVNAGAQQQLFNLQNQAAAAAAVTGAQQIQAQGQATYNALIQQGVNATIAEAVASQQVANARAQATASVEKQVRSLEDSTSMILAAANGTEAQTASAIAYKNAIESGASSTAAAALSAATLESYMAKAAVSAQQMDNAAASAATSAYIAGGGGTFNPDPNATTHTGSSASTLPVGFQAELEAQAKRTPTDFINGSFSYGGINAALATAKLPTLTGGTPEMDYAGNIHWVGQTLNSPDFNQVQSLYDLKNAQTNDNSVKVANYQDEMAWLQAQPETIARDQAIVNLMQSIDSLTTATNANTAATLNPLYTQGAGALAIGYYHAATGLDVVANGPTSGDQIPFHAMVNGGERIQITPKGQPGNNNSPSTTSSGPPVVNNVFNIGSVSTDNSRRNGRQIAQGFAQSMAAAR